MTDVRIKETQENLEAVTMDFLLLDSGLLDEREEMATSVRVALGTDRLAAVDEVLPDLDSTDRRGWWGDLDAEEIWSGWPIGCKNWLLTRAKITEAQSREGSTLQRARQYTKDALQPFIDKKVATLINTSAVRTELNRIEVTATIFRGPLAEIDLRYQILWQDDPALVVPVVTPVVVSGIIIPSGNLVLSSIGMSRGNLISIPSSNLVLSSDPAALSSSKIPFRRSDWPNPSRIKPRYQTIGTNNKISTPVVFPVSAGMGSRRWMSGYVEPVPTTWWYSLSGFTSFAPLPELDFIVGGKRWIYDFDSRAPTSWWYAKSRGG